MEPQIHYVKTSDGVNIAYYTIGQGPPVLYLSPLVASHLTFEWQIPRLREMYERAARNSTYIRFDPRGCGLSDRDVTDFSLDKLVLDIEAVLNQLKLERVRLIALAYEGMVAIKYATQHPDRLSHLVLWCTSASSYDTARLALTSLVEEDWEFASEAIMLGNMGRWGDAPSHVFGELMRQSVSKEKYLQIWHHQMQWNVTEILSQVSVPTLVAQRRELQSPPVEAARQLAAGIPGARLVLLEGSTPFWGPDVNAAVGAFFRDGEERRERSPAANVPSGTAVILFADIVDSTALTERLGDAAFREKARELDGALRSLIRENDGTPIEGKLLGDGVLAVFTSARQAIEAALACGRAGDEGGLPLHLGLHAGDVIRESDPDGRSNVYGGAVNIASRISGLSAPGEVLVSDTVRSLARTSAGVGFEDRGEQALKGVGEAVRVWAVREEDD